MSDHFNDLEVRQGVVIQPRRVRIHRARRNASGPEVTASGLLSGPRQRMLAVAAGASMLLLACCAGVSALVVQHMQRDTVVFDMKSTIDGFKQQTAQISLDENTARAMTARFSQALNESLAAWTETHDDLILVPGAVVRPVRDITPDIQSDIARRMKEAQ